MTQTSWLYEVMFMFLQVSPSYRLAHLDARGRLRLAANQLPPDFDVVRSVYADLGNVYYIDFDQWWFGKAQHRFGHDNALPAKIFDLLSQGEPATEKLAASITDALTAYLIAQRSAAFSPAVAVIGLPIYSDKEACKAVMNEMIDAIYGDQSAHEPGLPYRLVKNKRKHRDMIRLLQLVWLRCGFKYTNRHATAGHRLMSRIGLTKLNRTTPAKAGSRESVDQSTQKTNAAIAMQTRLREAYRMAENAARGIFPSEQPLANERTWDSFLGPDLHRLIRNQLRYQAWQEREYLRKLYPGQGIKRGREEVFTEAEMLHYLDRNGLMDDK
jgi:hypothetical protein